jgi:hypothetical protein
MWWLWSALWLIFSCSSLAAAVSCCCGGFHAKWDTRTSRFHLLLVNSFSIILCFLTESIFVRFQETSLDTTWTKSREESSWFYNSTGWDRKWISKPPFSPQTAEMPRYKYIISFCLLVTIIPQIVTAYQPSAATCYGINGLTTETDLLHSIQSSAWSVEGLCSVRFQVLTAASIRLGYSAMQCRSVWLQKLGTLAFYIS